MFDKEVIQNQRVASMMTGSKLKVKMSTKKNNRNQNLASKLR